MGYIPKEVLDREDALIRRVIYLEERIKLMEKREEGYRIECITSRLENLKRKESAKICNGRVIQLEKGLAEERRNVLHLEEELKRSRENNKKQQEERERLIEQQGKLAESHSSMESQYQSTLERLALYVKKDEDQKRRIDILRKMLKDGDKKIESLRYNNQVELTYVVKEVKAVKDILNRGLLWLPRRRNRANYVLGRLLVTASEFAEKYGCNVTADEPSCSTG